MTRWRTSSRSRRPSRRAASSAAAAPARSRSSMALHVCGLANKQVNEHCVFVNGWACGAPRQTNKQNRGVWFTFVSFVREHFGKKLTLLVSVDLLERPSPRSGAVPQVPCRRPARWRRRGAVARIARRAQCCSSQAPPATSSRTHPGRPSGTRPQPPPAHCGLRHPPECGGAASNPTPHKPSHCTSPRTGRSPPPASSGPAVRAASRPTAPAGTWPACWA